MQERHAKSGVKLCRLLGAGPMTVRSPGFAKSAPYRLSSADAARAANRDGGRERPRFPAEDVTGRP
ncbi:hypothetical protein [Bosea sp. CS1GBMeth4]|uniref:hypothetical protein n=1 Tax=Bosea sp. CS1GBMeth4 TaxID=1892849 RepID=UPI0016454450|nr:hypothetical protein [Bosea sp. CS1GBMeth4]